jgi:hypothetical protein
MWGGLELWINTLSQQEALNIHTLGRGWPSPKASASSVLSCSNSQGLCPRGLGEEGPGADIAFPVS